MQKRDGRTRVYRRRNEGFARNCVLEVDNFGEGSVMMWGAISYAEKLAEFAVLVDDCARVDPSHPQMFYWVQI
jgi:hypothetical protein